MTDPKTFCQKLANEEQPGTPSAFPRASVSSIVSASPPCGFTCAGYNKLDMSWRTLRLSLLLGVLLPVGTSREIRA
ncbi:MAG TPA: hypothetical protein VMF30_08610, partial [Pirellulales bacterium]|nr:hypothetical protein [Pirellulales bacterium]